jgi:N-formylglutamate deformylase
MDNQPFVVIKPKVVKVPFVLSIPHCGVEFPKEIKSLYNQELIKQPDDTDWFLQDLYDFASELGVTIIHAKYSRWVIDLNRDPESKPLYNDGRIITALTPITDFLGNSIYASPANQPDNNEVVRRIKEYYWPYYRKIEEIIEDLKKDSEHVLFWDAHSIRSFVPTIRKEKFPEMILGDNDEKTATQTMIQQALEQLRKSKFQVNHNTPFKGGHLTRFFGNPENKVYALQLEMIKSLYMLEDELTYDASKSAPVSSLLKTTFEGLIQTLKELNK